MPRAEQFLGLGHLPRLGQGFRGRLPQLAGPPGLHPLPGIPHIHAQPQLPHINYGAVAQVGRQQRRDPLTQGLPSFIQHPLHVPIAQQQLSKPEQRAMNHIWTDDVTGLKKMPQQVKQLIMNPTPAMQVHIHSMHGGPQSHADLQYAVANNDYNTNSPGWQQRINIAGRVPKKVLQKIRAQSLASQPMTEGLGVLPGLDNPLTRLNQRFWTGAAHAATGLGPGLVDLSKHAGMGLANVGEGALQGLGVTHPRGGLQGGVAEITKPHSFGSQTPYFKALGAAQLKSFKDSFTTEQFWKDPFTFLSNATIALSGVAGAGARVAELSDISRALKAGEITKAEAASQARRAIFRPQPVERSIQIGAPDKHFNKAGLDVMGHHKTDYRIPSPETYKDAPYLNRFPIFFRSDAPEKAVIGPLGEGHVDLIKGGHGHYKTHSQASAIIDPETGQVAQINLHDKMGGMSDEAQKALKEKLMDVVNEKVHEAHHEPYRITPPAVKGAFGGNIQKRILDPITEKAVQGKLHGVAPTVRAVGREVRLPNQLAGLLPEGKAGKLARREFELASQARRGVEEVKIARQFGLKGPYDPKVKGEMPKELNRDQQLRVVIQHLKLHGHHQEAIKEFEDQLHPGNRHEVNFSYDVAHYSPGEFDDPEDYLNQVPELDKAIEALVHKHEGEIVETGGGFGQRDFSVQLPSKNLRNFLTELRDNHTASGVRQFDDELINPDDPHAWPLTREGDALMGVTSSGGKTSWGALDSTDHPDVAENIRDYLERNAPRDPAYQAALDKFKEIDAGKVKLTPAQLHEIVNEGKIPRGVYLTKEERQQIHNIIQRHGHLHPDQRMVEEHLAHVHDEDSGHMVQIMGNEEPLNHGVNHVEHIPEIRDLIKKHGGDASHYTFGPEIQDLIQEAAGLPDELRPTTSTKTAEVHFHNYASAKNFENEFRKQITPKMDIGAQHHHINLETEGDIPDTIDEWHQIMHPDAPIQHNSQEFAHAVSKDLADIAQTKHVPTLPERTAAMSPEVRKKFAAEAQKRAFAQGMAKQHLDEWHKMFHGVLTHDEVLRGTKTPADVAKRMEDYVGVKPPPERINKWKQYAGDQAIARQIQGMVETDPAKLAASPGDYRYIPRSFWQRYKFSGPDVGHAATFINGMDAITQAVRAGRFMTPAYFAWAIQNGVLHLSQAGVFGIRNALRVKNEFGKMTPEQKAFFDNSVGAGHYGGGIARATAGSPESYRAVWTQKMAKFWHGIDDRPFRRMSLVHELAHAGYHTADDWAGLMKSDPKKFLTIARRAQQEAIDYSEMGPAEKATLQKLFTAWGWTRGASTYTMRFPFQHPAQFAGATALAREGQKHVADFYDKAGGLSPAWLAGYYPFGGNKLLDTGLLNPGETFGSLLEAIPGATKGQTESLAGEEAPGPAALLEGLTGQGRYGQAYRGNERVTGPLGELAKRFKPLGVLEAMANTKKGGGTFKQGPLQGIEQAFGSPLSELTNKKETAALGMKDYEQALSRPDEIKFRHDWAVQHIPQALATLAQHGTHLTPARVSKWKGDLAAVEQRDLWQVKYAGEHGARSFKSLPPINRYEAGIQFNLSHGYITPQAAKQKIAEASRINDDSILNTLATAEWENHAIGVVSQAYSSVLKALQPPSRLAARG
jgi:hypothetical protein